MVFFEEDQLIFRNSPPYHTPLDQASPKSASPVNQLSDLEILKSKHHFTDPALAVLRLTLPDCDRSSSLRSSATPSTNRMDSPASVEGAIGERRTPSSGVIEPVHHSAAYPSLENPPKPDATALGAKAAAAIAESESRNPRLGLTPQRNDSGHEEIRLQTSHSVSSSPSKIENDLALSGPDTTQAADVRRQSPTAYKLASPAFQAVTTSQSTLRRADSSASQEGGPVSPLTERLPSFRQFTGQLGQLGQLSELAEAAAACQEPTQAFSHNHKPSFGSATSQSPRLPYHHPYSNSAQTSPISNYAYTARSPTSTIGDSQHYGSPSQYQTTAYYANRRSGAIPESAIAFPPSVPSMPSASSSSESQGHAGSTSGDGYSTTHTTPIEQSQTATPRPILPPPLGMPASAVLMTTVFHCDYPGCNAPPFHTQYLLSSHRNVHSSIRPHYCPVKDCPRSTGGKGFKRKNEMIRHGLVHNSPGYVCPFCPDREHKYPRPDNLQRHVRVHHVDKDRDDPALRDVLAQRIEGTGKSRKRRTNFNGLGND